MAYGRNKERHNALKLKKLLILLIIPTECLKFCCTDLTLSVNILCKFAKITYFYQIFLYHYEYSRHNRPVLVIFNSFPKFSRRYFIIR